MAATRTPSAMTPPSKKRVRFEEDGETRQVRRRVQEIPLPKSSLLTTDEKTLYWMQHADHRETLNDVLSLMHDCHHKQEPQSSSAEDPHQVPFAQYAEALALTFTLCDTPPLEESSLWNIRNSQSVAQLALWASNHTPTRGVESKILPGLNQERQLRRSKTIQGVLEAQKRLRAVSTDEKSSSLCAVSEALSHSAKQFATALAVVDGTQALLEYQRDMDFETKKKQLPDKVSDTTCVENECLDLQPPIRLSPTSVLA